MASQMQIEQVVQSTRGLLYDIVSLLEGILCRERLSSRPLSIDQVAGSGYRAMVDLTCELVWIQDILTEIGFKPKTVIRLHCNNRSANYIVQNCVS